MHSHKSTTSSGKRSQNGSGRKPSPTFASGSNKFSLHAPLPSPKERVTTATTFSEYSRPIQVRAINLDDNDLLSQSGNYEHHDAEQTRSSLLESPAARSLLGSEVARQKHEYYMAQQSHLASQAEHEFPGSASNDNGEQSDETTAIAASVETRTVIERLQHDADPLSNDELALLIENLQDTLIKRGGKAVVSGRGAAQPCTSPNRALVNGVPNAANGVTSTTRHSIPSPFRSLDTSLVTDAVPPAGTKSTPLKSKTPSPYNHHHHHHHGSSNKDSRDHLHPHYTAPGGSPNNPTSTANTPRADQNGAQTTTSSGPVGLPFVGVGNSKDLISTSVLAAFEDSMMSHSSYSGRENIRRSLSGDATHIRGSHREKMEALSSGYHKIVPDHRPHSHKKSSASSNNNSGSSNANLPASKQALDEDDAELRAAPTPTKVITQDRSGAIPPLLEAWPPSPHPPIFESAIKHSAIHSPKVKSHKVLLRTPKVDYALPVGANPQRSDLGGGEDGDSLTIVSFDDSNPLPTEGAPHAPAPSGILTGITARATSDDSYLAQQPPNAQRSRANGGRDASGLVTSPNTAFDDLSVSSTNSAGGSVRSISSRSLEPQSSHKHSSRGAHPSKTSATSTTIASGTINSTTSARTGIFSFLAGSSKTN